MVSFIFARRDCLKQAETDALGRSTRPNKDTFVISGSGHFYIHYDTTGIAAPDLTDDNGNEIPDYIDEVGMIADSAHHVLVEIMGYTEEPFDGDGGYDIYIESYATNIYGFNTPDSPSLNSEGQTSFFQIDNDYVGFNSNFNLSPIKIMQISVAHEYFHGIQWGYRKNTSGSKYLYEMTSTWFEDILIPDGNDYLDGFADALLNNPTEDFGEMGSGYELALFGHYLSSFIDENGQTDEMNSSIMREIWEHFTSNSTSPSAFLTIQSLLETQYNMSFTEAWTDFISRNLYNGMYEDVDNPFYYYGDQALIDPITTNPVLLDDSQDFVLDLDNKSVAIQSYQLGNLNALLNINHSSDEYLGRISIVSTSDYNDIFWGKDSSSLELSSNSEIHFVYGSENSSGLVEINLMSTSPPSSYDYSLIDINPTSDTYLNIISPGSFDNEVTLHYFGHQN